MANCTNIFFMSVNDLQCVCMPHIIEPSASWYYPSPPFEDIHRRNVFIFCLFPLALLKCIGKPHLLQTMGYVALQWSNWSGQCRYRTTVDYNILITWLFNIEFNLIEVCDLFIITALVHSAYPFFLWCRETLTALFLAGRVEYDKWVILMIKWAFIEVNMHGQPHHV